MVNTTSKKIMKSFDLKLTVKITDSVLKCHSTLTGLVEGNSLLVSYNSKLLQDVCFNSSIAKSCLGQEAALSLAARHSDIQAANNVFELPVGAIYIDGNRCFLSVSNLLKIELSPNYPAADNNSFYDWNSVARVKVMGINNVT